MTWGHFVLVKTRGRSQLRGVEKIYEWIYFLLINNIISQIQDAVVIARPWIEFHLLRYLLWDNVHKCELHYITWSRKGYRTCCMCSSQQIISVWEAFIRSYVLFCFWNMFLEGETSIITWSSGKLIDSTSTEMLPRKPRAFERKLSLYMFKQEAKTATSASPLSFFQKKICF